MTPTSGAAVVPTSSTPTRRAVLRTGALVGATAALGGAGVLTTALTAGATPLRLTRTLFLPHVGSAYGLVDDDRSRRATLHAVEDTPVSPGHLHRFVLDFRVSDGDAVEGLYRLEHVALPPVTLFLAPTGRVAGRLEAVVHG